MCGGIEGDLTDGSPLLGNQCFVGAQMQDIEAVAGGHQPFIGCAGEHKQKRAPAGRKSRVSAESSSRVPDVARVSLYRTSP